jgi:hypothetical protein
MKQDKVVFLIFLSLLTSLPSYGKGLSQETVDRENLKFIAKYLTSLDQASRSRLASKLYYLDPLQKKQETQSTLLEELIKSGRVSNDNGLSTGPRTVSCESRGTP